MELEKIYVKNTLKDEESVYVSFSGDIYAFFCILFEIVEIRCHSPPVNLNKSKLIGGK